MEPQRAGRFTRSNFSRYILRDQPQPNQKDESVMAERKKKRRWWKVLLLLIVLLAIAGYVVYGGGQHEEPGVVTPHALPDEIVAERAAAQQAAHSQLEPGSTLDEQILFGDLHVHSTFSADAFMRSLPILGGEGTHPPADACDFARYCSGLDFFALTDHAEALSPQHWQESKESIRQCNAVAGDPENPDLVAFMGWEWSQVGLSPEEHYGHRNVIFRDVEDDELPARSIAAPGMGDAFRRVQGATWLKTFLIPVIDFSRRQRYLDLFTYLRENAIDECPRGIDTRELPDDCREVADSPRELYEKLNQWGFDSLVIPHGTTWGFYTPPGYDWDKQIDPAQDDPERQRLIEIHSGHGNSEEYRRWRHVEFDDEGDAFCPEPSEGFEACCWRAGEIIRSRCGDIPEAECEGRVDDARDNYLAVGVAGHTTIPGATLEDWGTCGQCEDCFQPAFNARPGGSVQYILARGNFDDPETPYHARFGFISSSDNHTARPGTGFKEVERRRMTEATGPESEVWGDRIFGEELEPASESLALTQEDLLERPAFAVLHLERQSSFFLTGGLVAVHSEGRSRDAIWQGLNDRQVYGTSGPRILLWFDLINGPDGERPMGSEVQMGAAPTFTVRAVGAFRQNPGCADWSTNHLTPERLEHICAGECYNPSDERLNITRIEVVRIRPQASDDEPLDELIEDVWRTLPCEPTGTTCEVSFDDPSYSADARDSIYYVRAIQEPTPAVNADAVRCDDDGNCDPCYGDYRTAFDDDCLSDTEERAWSSPIYLDYVAPPPAPEPVLPEVDEVDQEQPGVGE